MYHLIQNKKARSTFFKCISTLTVTAKHIERFLKLLHKNFNSSIWVAQKLQLFLNKISGLTMRTVTWNRFPVKNLLLIPCFFQLWSEVTRKQICASFNHRKKVKVEPSRLIPRKPIENLKLSFDMYCYQHFVLSTEAQSYVEYLHSRLFKKIPSWKKTLYYICSKGLRNIRFKTFQTFQVLRSYPLRTRRKRKPDSSQIRFDLVSIKILRSTKRSTYFHQNVRRDSNCLVRLPQFDNTHCYFQTVFQMGNYFEKLQKQFQCKEIKIFGVNLSFKFAICFLKLNTSVNQVATFIVHLDIIAVMNQIHLMLICFSVIFGDFYVFGFETVSTASLFKYQSIAQSIRFLFVWFRINLFCFRLQFMLNKGRVRVCINVCKISYCGHFIVTNVVVNLHFATNIKLC